MRRWFTLTPFDGWLLLMVLIWGANFSLIKAALVEIPPQSFNALRLVVATALFLVAIVAKGWPSLSRKDWLLVGFFGFIGHFIYQIGFLGGLARTTASNSSLILGCSPVAVALASGFAGHERVSRNQLAGAGLSVVGIYLVVGTGAHFGGTTLAGDFLTLGALLCWTIYTVGSRSLLARHSPLVVTGLTMCVGTMFYVTYALPELRRLDMDRVPVWAWIAVVFSSVLALNVAYMIWYTSVQRIGNIRTSVYSNVTPLIAMTVAAITLGETITMSKIGGAAAILTGLFITRRATGPRAGSDPPAEE